MPQTSRFPRIAPLSCAVLLTCAAPGHAQQPAEPAEARKTAADAPQKVEISGAKGYDERRHDTASKIVVTQEEIQRYGDATVADVLKRLPGVTIGGVAGRGGEIRMRGLGSGYTQILLNGEPSPPGFSLDSLAPDLIERIEVIRSGSAEYSTQAIAGTINIVLKKAVQTAQKEAKFGLNEEGGKYGASLNLQLSDKLGPMSYSVSGSFNHSQFVRPSSNDESARNAAGKPTLARHSDTLDIGSFSGLGLSKRVNWNLENGDTVTSQVFLNANRFKVDVRSDSVTSLGAPPPAVSSRSHVESQFAMLRGNLNWIRKLADSAKLDVKLGFGYYRRSANVDVQEYGLAYLPTFGRLVDSVADDASVTLSGKYTAPFIEHHALAFGWDGASGWRDETRGETATPAGAAAFSRNEDYDARIRRLALFAQDEWSIDQHWSLYAGLRWEGFETHSAGNSYAEIHNRSGVWSPIVQTLWKLPDHKNDQLRFGLTRSYKAPDTWRLIPRRFVAINNSPTNPDAMGNPGLRPELAWGLDGAFEHYLPQGGMVSISAYVRRIDDIVLTQLSNENGTWVNRPVNAGQASTRGIELEAKLPLRTLLAEAPALDLRANLAFNWSTLDSVPGPDNRLDSQTPVSANFGADYKFDKTPLTVGGNYSFQNGGPVRLSAAKTGYSAPKRLLDLYALWKFDPKTSLRLSLANALHQDTVAANSYSDSNGVQTQVNTTPTMVAARALLEMKF